MSRSQIFADQLTDPGVAARLHEHREDRDALLGRLVKALQADPRVRCAWLWGSFGRGEADDLSDLDPWIIVPDEYVPEMGAGLREHLKRVGTLVAAGEAPQNAPPGGGYLGALLAGRQGLLQIDCYWQSQSAIDVVPTQSILLNRLVPPLPRGDWQAVTGGRPGRQNTGDRGRIEGGIDFMWLMLSIAAKWLARDPASDLGLAQYPRVGFEEAVALLGQQDTLLPLDWSVPTQPQEKVERLQSLARKAEQLTSAANTQGFSFSPLYAPSLYRYLDLVAGILADSQR